jgi:hypothetical protein
MTRAKLSAIIIGTLLTLAVSATPALAEFQSGSAETKGPLNTGPLVIEGGGGVLECAPGKAVGTWTIFSGGTPATKGTELRLDLTTWSGCQVKSSLIKKVNATVKACILQLVQAAGESKAKGSTVSTCAYEFEVIGECTISLPADQTGLETNTLENIGGNLNARMEDTGITLKPSKVCLGFEETKEAKYKITVSGENLKWT